MVIDPATVPENRHRLIPRFADPVWPVTDGSAVELSVVAVASVSTVWVSGPEVVAA